MDEILMMLIKIIVIVCVILLTRYVIPAVKTWCEVHMSKELRDAVKECVEAAEQTITGSGRGQDKYDRVMTDLINLHMNVKGDVDTTKLNRMIESAVFQMNKEKNKEETGNEL